MVRKVQKHESVFLYIEGGGDRAALHDELRYGFAQFFSKAGCRGTMPRIVACGGRAQAFDRFQTACANGKRAILLVDSETLVNATCESPWEHFQTREGDERLVKPQRVSDDDAHLMVCCMESWFLADRDALTTYFGHGFNENALPHENNQIESIPKERVLGELARATKNSRKGQYDKGRDSFTLIGLIDPQKIEEKSPWAERLLKKLRDIHGIQ